MSKGDHLGEFELLVLLSLIRLRSNANGLRVRREIEECTRRPTSDGATYATLRRLDRKGYVRSYPRKFKASIGGRSGTDYKITMAGQHAVALSLSAVALLREGID